MEKIVVLSGKRTPFGKFGGSLMNLSPTDLGEHAANAAIESAGIPASEIDHVIFGNVVQTLSDTAYVSRHIGLRVGAPIQTPAFTVNRLCGSGFQSWISATQQILLNESSVALVGGTENMSKIPYLHHGARWGARMGPTVLEDLLMAALTDQHINTPMAITAENLAEQYKLNREVVDEFALRSQSRFAKATKEGVFKNEISAIEISSKKGPIKVTTDEHAREDTTMESLAKLKPVFKKDGVVTAGNASGIVDGAAASIICSESFAKSNGLKPLAEIKAWSVVGCDPKIMGIGPVHAIKNVLKKSKLEVKDIDIMDVNEAFSSQYLAVEKELGLDIEKTNVNGGAIAIGHPLGATGTRIMNHLVHELQRTNKNLAIGSACIGGGQGIAILIERL